jgi:hypothetical protein
MGGYVANLKKTARMSVISFLIMGSAWVIFASWLFLPSTPASVIIALTLISVCISINRTRSIYILFNYKNNFVVKAIEDSFSMLLTKFKKDKNIYTHDDSGVIIRHTSLVRVFSVGSISFAQKQTTEKARLIRSLILKKIDTAYPTIHINLTN